MVADSFFEELEPPLCRTESGRNDAAIVKPVLEKLIEEKELNDVPVWANLSASQIVGRFVRLPPVTDKNARQLLEKEIEHRIPIAMNELAMVRWMDVMREEQIGGRPAIVFAARQQVIVQRLDLLELCGRIGLWYCAAENRWPSAFCARSAASQLPCVPPSVICEFSVYRRSSGPPKLSA